MVESISYYFWVKKLNKKGKSQRRQIQIDLRFIDKLYISYNPGNTGNFNVQRSDSRMLLFNFNDISFNFSSDEISMTAKLPDEISMTAKPIPESRVFKFIFDKQYSQSEIQMLADTIDKKKNIHLLKTNIKKLYGTLVRIKKIDFTSYPTINYLHHQYDKNKNDETNIVRFIQRLPHFETPDDEVRERHPRITLQQILDKLYAINEELVELVDSVELSKGGGSRKSRKSKRRKSKRRKSKRRKSRR